MSDLFIDLGGSYSKIEADAKYLLNTTDTLTGNLTISGDLIVDTATLYIKSSNNRVGVGTTNPDGPLHVYTGSAGSLTPHADGDDLVLESSGQTGMSIMGPDASEQVIFFASPSNNRGAFMRWRNSTNLFAIGPNNTNGVLSLNSGAFAEALRVDGNQNIGIGTTSIDAAALVEITSTTQGFLPPRMTTTQRDAISSPPAGLMIYNTSTNKLNVYTTAWEAVTSA